MELEEKIEERTQELNQSLQQLEANHLQLQQTQFQLIQSEKMASLGQLIAGIAHEINTPMGAIKASSETISHYLPTFIEQLPLILAQLSAEEQQCFLKMIQQSNLGFPKLSMKEQRKKKKELRKQLEEQQVPYSHQTAEILMSLGITEEFEEYLSLLTHPESEDILQMAFAIVDTMINNRNVLNAADKAGKIVYALKSYSHHSQNEEMEKIDLQTNIEIVLDLYHNQIKQGCTIIRNYPPTLQPIFCYPDELGQVWTNLVHNALQAMNYQGTLSLQLEQTERETVVAIGDTGSGIPEEIQEKIFQPFFTTKPAGEGSGLGLDIIRKIVEKHQGSIHFESKVGEGTTFRVFLPHVDPDAGEMFS